MVYLLQMLLLNWVVEIIGTYIMQQKVEDKFCFELMEKVGIKKLVKKLKN